MKKLSFFFCCLLFSIFANTQNVGIGTTTPLQKLHVDGASFLNGNVGISNASPSFPLSFSTALGDKISLWSNSENSYGFGIQSSLLQIHTDVYNADISFGYGSSSIFTERVRMINNGPDGMILKGRLNLKNGTIPIDPNETPGIWLYKTDNISQLAFIGAQNEQNIGFYGGSGQWGFVYDAINSRIGIGTSFPNHKLHVEGTTLFNGNVGISNNTPYAPLTFSDNLGEKISFYGNTVSSYGIGLQSGLLQIHTDGSGADIAIGYYNGGAFTENMRIKGNSLVGIGNNNPSYQLDLSNRMRIRSGGNNSVSAGLWLNNNSNDEAAFIGMEDDTHVGIFGTGTGWKFSMNTQNGALKINGSEGQPGQILQSNGTGNPSTWTNAGNVIKTYYVAPGGLGTDVTSSSWVDIPGTTFNINLTVKSRLIISATFTAWGIFCPGGGCTSSCASITIEVNGSIVTLPFDKGITLLTAAPNADGSANISNYFYDLPAGEHTIKFKVKLGCNQSNNLIDNLRCSMGTIISLPID